MSLRNRGLVLAMEDDTLVDPAPVEVAPELPVEVEQGAAEVAEQVAEVEDLNTAIEEAEADAETLGEIQETLAETVESGEGVDETTAEVAEIAVEAICARLGIRSQQKVIPALESFGSKGSKLTATKVAVEGISDTLKKVWEAIKKAFVTVWQKIKDFFAKFFDNSEKVKKLAESLKEKAKAGEFKEGKVKFGGAAALNEDGDVSVASTNAILANHGNLTTQVLSSVEYVSKVVGVLSGALSKDSESKESLGEGLGKAGEALVAALSKGFKTQMVMADDTHAIKAGPFVGGDTIQMAYNVKAMTFGFEVAKATKPAPAEVTALNQEQALAVCEEVIALMDKTNEFKKQQSKIDGVNKAMVDLVNAGIKVADKVADGDEKGAEAKAKLAEARKAITSLNSFTSRLITMTPAMNVRAGKSALNFVSASMGKAEEKKPEEGEKK